DLGGVVRVYQLPLGSRADQLRTGGRSARNGDVPYLGAAVRAAAVLFVDRGPLPPLHAHDSTTRAWQGLRLYVAGAAADPARLPAGVRHALGGVVRGGARRAAEGVGQPAPVRRPGRVRGRAGAAQPAGGRVP